MKKYIKQLLTLLIFLVSISLLLSQLSFASMDLIYDLNTAKVSGMGGSYVSGNLDSDSIFHNWSKPGTHLEWKVEQATIIEDPYYLASIQSPFHVSWLRLGMLYQSSSDLNETILNEFNQPELTGSTFNHYMVSLFTSASKTLFNTHIGLRHTLFYESIKSENVLAQQLDLAINKQLTLFKTPVEYGASVKNVFKSNIKWSTNTKELSPRIFSTGISTKLFKNRLIVSTDRTFSFQDGYNKTSAGMQYYALGNETSNPYMLVRAGICKTELSVGTSINIEGWIFDYAYTFDTPFSAITTSETLNQHRFSLGKSFQSFKDIKNKIDFNSRDLNSNSAYKLESFFTTQKENNLDENQQKNKIVSNLTLDVDLESNISTLYLDSLSENYVSRLNFNPIKQKSTIQQALPLKLIIYEKSENNTFMLDLETTQTNKLHLSGYIPNYLEVFINNEKITVTKSDNSFYKKISPETPNSTLKISVERKH